MKRFALIVAVALSVPSPARAQSAPEATVSWTLELFLAGVSPVTGTPVQAPATFLKATSACNQAPAVTPPGGIMNPTRVIVADPDTAGRECVLGPNTAGTLQALPLGVGYVGTVRANGATLQSARSAASLPFSRAATPGPPPTPAAPRVVP